MRCDWIEAARGVTVEEGVDLVGIVEFEVNGAGSGVIAHMHGELKNSGVAYEVNDAVAHRRARGVLGISARSRDFQCRKRASGEGHCCRRQERLS